MEPAANDLCISMPYGFGSHMAKYPAFKGIQALHCAAGHYKQMNKLEQFIWCGEIRSALLQRYEIDPGFEEP